MSRRVLALTPTIIGLLPASAYAQDTDRPGLSADEQACQRKQEAAIISGEIVVCGDRETNDRHRLAPRSEARKRFAEETMDRGLALAPDFRPPPCVPSLLTWCPKFGAPPPAPVEIDLSALPEAPPGSDADRIARGVVPQ